MGFCRCLDYLFFLYFLTHIPVTILLDSQAVLPANYYPKPVLDLIQWYCKEFKDPLMSAPPPWFQSFIVCELIFQLPFFCVAAFSFLTGTSKKIRLPLIVYSAHVMTTVIPILSQVALSNFEEFPNHGPKTVQERATLAAIYAPYFIIPLMILLRTLFSFEYRSFKSETKETVKKELISVQPRRNKKKQY